MKEFWVLLVEPPSCASRVAPSCRCHRSERYPTKFPLGNHHCCGVEVTDTVLGLLELRTETTSGLFVFAKFIQKRVQHSKANLAHKQ